MTLKLGRLPRRKDKRRLQLKNYLPATLPPPPSAVDWGSKVPDFGMLLNDTLGDCTAAAAAHAEMLWTANAATEYLPTDADVLTFYECISGYDPSDPSTDTGANMLDVLNYWRQVGFNGRKITAFAEVDNDPMEIKNAIALFGCIYCGVNLPQSAMDDFENGQAWMNIHDKSNIGGHCILESAYDAQGITSVTWGKSQPTTWPWFKKFCDERYVIITPEWIAENGNSPSGFNFAQLQADLAAFE